MTMMRAAKSLTPNSAVPFVSRTPKSNPNIRWVPLFQPHSIRFSVPLLTNSKLNAPSSAHTSSPAVASDLSPGVSHNSQGKLDIIEENIEKVIYRFRFFAILAVCGSLVGSVLCFIKGCTYIVASFQEYFVNRAKVTFLLVEALDVYLLGTVMLVFGMGLYELFISNLDKENILSAGRLPERSNIFGLFALKERPRWLEIRSVNELKTKIGHVIVMLLLIGLLDKTKKATILTPVDLLCFAASVLLSSGCLFLLSKLSNNEE